MALFIVGCSGSDDEETTTTSLVGSTGVGLGSGSGVRTPTPIAAELIGTHHMLGEKIIPSEDTPPEFAEALSQGRPVVLLFYVQGSLDDTIVMEWLVGSGISNPDDVADTTTTTDADDTGTEDDDTDTDDSSTTSTTQYSNTSTTEAPKEPLQDLFPDFCYLIYNYDDPDSYGDLSTLLEVNYPPELIFIDGTGTIQEIWNGFVDWEVVNQCLTNLANNSDYTYNPAYDNNTTNTTADDNDEEDEDDDEDEDDTDDEEDEDDEDGDDTDDDEEDEE